ncbi:hypothetical protein BS50DRAFT_569050 [Corynespora cassiicola Philippines]|uniref:50S ribosomal protein-like protein YmL27 n=1 Tax=Corynespora cassiicola Philippines TaxID=1448308 RepID=A0A2T2P791_CORCC|nr:hypothetical protein BS50DRAFT_569050 [Corynespora cassiicola Philippines]
MFRATQALQSTIRRLPLSTKQAGKEYYKGNRVGNMGTIDKYGNFHPDYSKVRTYMYPVAGVKDFELTPFVAESIEKARQVDVDQVSGEPLYEAYGKKITGEEYLKQWKVQGGRDPTY